MDSVAEKSLIKMRVLIVSGAYGPDFCGVGDYTGYLADKLSCRDDIQLGVLTASPLQQSDAQKIQFFISRNKSVSAVDGIKAIKEFKPDIVHIQYPTRHSVSRWIPCIAKWLFRTRVIQTWHEHYNECTLLSYRNLFGLDGLVYVRRNLPEKLPAWLRWFVKGIHQKFIPNASTIPTANLTADEQDELRKTICSDRKIVTYFGFANPNKGVELLFSIADPKKHHLLLLCDLSVENLYQKKLIELSQSDVWRGRVTVMGYLEAEKVARFLSISDAVVFPFIAGAGEWNTSVQAALASGAPVLATAYGSSETGYQLERNLYLSPCGDIKNLQLGLATIIGKRGRPAHTNDWDLIAQSHREFYEVILDHA